MTAKLTASADGTKVTLGTAAEDALQIDATAKRIKALAPYTLVDSGQVLQEKFYTSTGGSTAGATPFKVAGNFTITPKSANSTIFVSMWFEGNMALVAGTNPFGTFRIKNVGTTSDVGSTKNLNATISAGGVGIITPCGIAGAEANTALTAKSYGLYAQTDSGAATVTAGNVVVSIREIQN